MVRRPNADFYVTQFSDPPKRDLERLILGTSEESFRLIVETIPGLIAVMTPEGQVEHVNRQVLEYFGRTLEDLKQWGTTDAVHPADLPGAIAAWQHAVETGLPCDFNTVSVGPMGSIGGFNRAVSRCATQGATSFVGTTC
jgi:PAS domain S-box-containing protein